MVQARGNEALVLALPKGRILSDVMPLLRRTGLEIEPAFDDPKSRLLRFKTNMPMLDVVRVRNFDVATFVAFGAAHLGPAVPFEGRRLVRNRLQGRRGCQAQPRRFG